LQVAAVEHDLSVQVLAVQVAVEALGETLMELQVQQTQAVVVAVQTMKAATLHALAAQAVQV
jgi:hypothetical protein